ncbi:MAG: hypothetical protein ACRDP6_23420 [Actinoallomurus sp.]
MTIIFEVPPLTLPADLAEALRALLPIIEPIALAVAAACGAGVVLQLGLDAALRLVRRALAE